jgi:hypothetical protein
VYRYCWIGRKDFCNSIYLWVSIGRKIYCGAAVICEIIYNACVRVVKLFSLYMRA